MVEHRFKKILMCHHCGHKEPVPKACPVCHTEGDMVPVGPGIERLAEEALKNAKGELDIAKAQSELAVMAAQITALRKYRQKR